jgi:hypothetical protein
MLGGEETARAFLRGELKVIVPGLMVPTAAFDIERFIKGGKVIAEEQDARSSALARVDFGTVDFVSCLNAGEGFITGEEKLKRLKADGRIRLGTTLFAGLWADYQAHGENSVLEKLYRLKKLTYLDFFGDVVQHPGGNRYVLCLFRLGGGWRWFGGWLDDGWSASRVSAVSPACNA